MQSPNYRTSSLEKAKVLFVWNSQAFWTKKLWSYCRQNQDKTAFFCDNFEINENKSDDFLRKKLQETDLLLYMWEFNTSNQDFNQLQSFLTAIKKYAVKKVVLISQQSATNSEYSLSQKKSYDLEALFINQLFPELFVLRMGIVWPQSSEIKNFVNNYSIEANLGSFYALSNEPLTSALKTIAALPFVLAVPYAKSNMALIDEVNFNEYIHELLNELLLKSHKVNSLDENIQPKINFYDTKNKEFLKNQSLENALKTIGASVFGQGKRFVLRNRLAVLYLNFLGKFFKNIKNSLQVLENYFTVNSN